MALSRLAVQTVNRLDELVLQGLVEGAQIAEGVDVDIDLLTLLPLLIDPFTSLNLYVPPPLLVPNVLEGKLQEDLSEFALSLVVVVLDLVQDRV